MRGNHKDAINSNEHLRAVRAYHVKKLHGFNKISMCEQTHASLPCVNRELAGSVGLQPSPQP